MKHVKKLTRGTVVLAQDTTLQDKLNELTKGNDLLGLLLVLGLLSKKGM